MHEDSNKRKPKVLVDTGIDDRVKGISSFESVAISPIQHDTTHNSMKEQDIKRIENQEEEISHQDFIYYRLLHQTEEGEGRN